jgi:N-acetylglutamate synthase-like GNAT family acetyltransferase
MIIKQINFEEIKTVWASKLWPSRISPIKSYSAMLFMGDSSGKFSEQPARFLAGYIDDKIVAVNSIHLAERYMARSRGLWVDENYRGQGLGIKILNASSDLARKLGAQAIWSFPRQSSFKTYQAVGFIQTSLWLDDGEFGPNCYAIKTLIDTN